MISIVTICRNDLAGLRKTMNSVGHSGVKAEHIIVDGASTDGTVEFLIKEKKKNNRLKIVSGPDRGIYDAMNKGIAASRGEWLIFMNAGDEFASPDSLQQAADLLGDDVDIVYSDTILHRRGRRQTIHCAHEKMTIIHQSFLYRKSLHDLHGNYLVARGVSVSDYIFFNQCRRARWKKSRSVIGLIDGHGTSSKSQAFYQKLAVDVMFGNANQKFIGLVYLFYPLYKFLKNLKQAVFR